MKAPPFRYARASTLADVFRLKSEGAGAAQLLAGGQSLMASLAFRLSEPSVVIDITHVPDLKGIGVLPTGHLRIGALITHRELGTNPDVRGHAPLLAEAVPLIAHAAIRNRGTIGGSIAYADPAAELPACCVALDAAIVAVGPRGERRIPAASFFTGLFTTALADDELIVAVEVPSAGAGERSSILELARRAGDYAMAGIAARTRVENDRPASPRLVYFGVGAGPVEARQAAAALGSGPWRADAIRAAEVALDRDLDPPADRHGGPEFKRHLARVLLVRALTRLDRTAEVRAA